MTAAAQLPAARQDERRTGRDASYLVFQLPGAVCALPLSAIREIVPMARLSRPPGLPALLEGFLNLGGASVAVLRLAGLLRLDKVVPTLYTPLLILRTSEDRLALLVSAVQGIVTASPGDVRSGGVGNSFNDCIEGEITANGRVVHLLSAERLLLEKERQCLAEFQALEQERLRILEEVRS